MTQNTIEEKNVWPKKITVDKRIVKILSESTYENFPKALKELVTNSYDADARNVWINIDLKRQRVEIEDDGKGMTETDFTFYLTIAGKRRKKDEGTTQLGREIIGQFGVGFLSVFPFFESYQIQTKTLNGPLLTATIPLAKYFTNDNKPIDISSIKIEGSVTEAAVKDKNSSYTKIVLNGFSPLTRTFFFSNKSMIEEEEAEEETVKTKKKGRAPKHQLQGLELLRWYLCEDLPLKWKNDKFNDIFNYADKVPFKVWFDDKELYRNSFGDTILESHKDEYSRIGKIRFKYFVATPNKKITNPQGRYFKIRNLNVGVGPRDDFGMDKGEGAYQRWLYGEIHIVSGLNDIIRISRDGFNFNSDFEQLKNFFHSLLRKYSNMLDEQARFQKEVKQTGKSFRVSNIRLLNKDNLTSKLEAYRKNGYAVKVSGKKSSKPIVVNEEKKEIVINPKYANFEKSIIVNSKKYRVIAEKWDHEDDEFPACRVDGNIVIINESYPLFHSVKYTDIFVKVHLALVLNYTDKNISRNTFKLLSGEILSYCKDYIK